MHSGQVNKRVCMFLFIIIEVDYERCYSDARRDSLLYNMLAE